MFYFFVFFFINILFTYISSSISIYTCNIVNIYLRMSEKYRLTTEMIIPVSKETYFNTKWKPPVSPLCAYDMLFHPPDYNPKAARSDRMQQELIRKNIWIQEYHKGIPSTTHFQHGRPKWKPYDLPNKQYTRAIYKNENEHMRINYVLEWASLVSEGKPDHCIQ